VRQYVPALSQLGLEVHEYVARFGSYPPVSQLVRPFWGIATLAQRIPGIVASHICSYDLSLLQREFFSTMDTLEGFTKCPRILDVDDAIWVHRRGAFARRLAARCDAVICGNTFLAENFSKWNPNVSILPTAVDTNRYRPANRRTGGAKIIGWSGSSSGLRYLYTIEPALAKVLRRHRKARVRIVSNAAPSFQEIQPHQLEYIPWSPLVEVEALQEMTVGLMLLDDGPWSRGKCSYKMLLYMACGVPVVVAPVGMNAEILARSDVGIGASTLAEWTAAIDALLSDPQGAAVLGENGRREVVSHYSLKVLAPRLASYLTRLMQ